MLIEDFNSLSYTVLLHPIEPGLNGHVSSYGLG